MAYTMREPNNKRKRRKRHLVGLDEETFKLYEAKAKKQGLKVAQYLRVKAREV